MARTPTRPVARAPESDEDATDYSSNDDEFPTLKELLLNVETPAKRNGPIVNVRSAPVAPAPARIARPSTTTTTKVVTSVRRPADVAPRTVLASNLKSKEKCIVPKPSATKGTATKTAGTRRPSVPVSSRIDTATATIDSDSGSEEEQKPSPPRRRRLVKKADLEKELPKKAAPKKEKKMEFSMPDVKTEGVEFLVGEGFLSSDSDSDSKPFVTATSTRHDDVKSSYEEEVIQRTPVAKVAKPQRSSKALGLEDMFSKASISKPTPRRRLVQKKYLEPSSSSASDSETLPELPRSKLQSKTAAIKKMANIPFVLEDVFPSASGDEESDEPVGGMNYPNSPEPKTPKPGNRSRAPEKKQPVSTFGRKYSGGPSGDTLNKYRTPRKRSNPEVIEISSDSESEAEGPNEDSDIYESEDDWIVEDGGRYGGYKRPKTPKDTTTVVEYLQDDDGGYNRYKVRKTETAVQEYFQDQDEADEQIFAEIADAESADTNSNDDSDITDGNGDSASSQGYGSYDSGEVPKTPRTVTKPKAAKTVGKSNFAAKREFEAKKEALAESFVRKLDRMICDGAVGKFHESRGGIRVEWNPKLRTTAGRARLSKGIIELSTKVITDEARLYNTTAHEFCHLAVWAVDNSKTDHHGPLFKRWGALVGRKFSDLGITVTRCHSYEIEYKYHLSCQTEHCSYVWKQQSKPKDVGRMRCPRCRLGVLLQTKPVLRDPKPLTEYQTFTKQHMARIKRENPGSPLKEVMRMVGREWEAYKAGKTPLRASEGGSVAASGEWSDSDTQTRRHPLESMMDYLQI